MQAEGIPYRDTGYFSPLITDYLNQEPDLEPFYHRFPEIHAFGAQIREKQAAYPAEHRPVVCRVLDEQYAGLEVSEATRRNLDALRQPHTFTVVTGHQLNLFTGPLYFHYKILTAIQLCRQLQAAYPAYHFVPVYWMATEDHDFDEVNHFNFKGKEIRWNRPSSGAVGRLKTDGLDSLYQSFSQDLGPGKTADTLRDLFRRAYLEQPDMASATRYLVNRLFGQEGLVILDADDARLKTVFLPHMKQDAFERLAHGLVSEEAGKLQSLREGYAAQVTPREINLFYLKDGLRSRLVEESGTYGVLDTGLRFTREALEAEMDRHPERFSPNVITRPLYQEVLLPNLCYIGGGGELAYWLELRSYFEAAGTPFPMLLLRNSALLISEKQRRKAARLGVGPAELFMEQNRLINKKVREISNIDIDFGPQREHLQKQFKHLYSLAAETDPSFLGAVKAQEIKQLKGLDRLEKRLLKAQKRKLKDQVSRLVALQSELFPGGSLQERSRNFAEFYLETAPEWSSGLLGCFDPLGAEFSVITY